MNELLVATTGTLIAALVVHEIKAWFPRLCDWLIMLAVKRLPKRQRPRYAEEWCAHVMQVPGAVIKVWHALGFVIGAGHMFPQWQSRVAYQRAVVRNVVAIRITIRVLDLVCVVPALIAVAPLMTLIAIANSFTGPSIYRQRINSPAGTTVFAPKFRTMQVNDSQPTRLGMFLRRTSIDDLPILFSVISGEVSLIAGEKAGLIPAEYALPDFSLRKSPKCTALAYIKTVWRVLAANLH